MINHDATLYDLTHGILLLGVDQWIFFGGVGRFWGEGMLADRQTYAEK